MKTMLHATRALMKKRPLFRGEFTVDEIKSRKFSRGDELLVVGIPDNKDGSKGFALVDGISVINGDVLVCVGCEHFAVMAFELKDFMEHEIIKEGENA